MADFSVQVLPVHSIEPIPAADNIVAAVVYGYRCVVPKDTLSPGDKVVYIPTGSVVPGTILVEMGLVGRLAGSQHNRVRPAKFKGCLSEGLCYIPSWLQECALFSDVTGRTGVTKYEPPIPLSLRGQVSYLLAGKLLHFDVEDYKRYPHIIAEGEMVSLTEKAHGTFVLYASLPDMPGEVAHEGWAISSKGIAKAGLCFTSDAVNAQNVYVRTARESDLQGKFARGVDALPFLKKGIPVYVLGEIIGVQDLRYGLSGGHTRFLAFDVYIGEPRKGRFLDRASFKQWANCCGVDTVPTLYEGPFSPGILSVHTSGLTGIGDARQIREGVVIRPLAERDDPEIGRVMLKSVSEAYHLRKGAVTELA